MSAKFKFVPDATFEHTVYIPIAGAEDAALVMTFKHKSTRELSDEQKEFSKKYESAMKIKDEEKRVEAVKKIQVEFLRLFCAGWEVEEPFSDENIIQTMANYPRFFDALTSQYQAELYAVRQKR